MAEFIAPETLSVATGATGYYYIENPSGSGKNVKVSKMKVYGDGSADVNVYWGEQTLLEDTEGSDVLATFTGPGSQSEVFNARKDGAYTTSGAANIAPFQISGSGQGENKLGGDSAEDDVKTLEPGDSMLVEVNNTSGSDSNYGVLPKFVEQGI